MIRSRIAQVDVVGRDALEAAIAQSPLAPQEAAFLAGKHAQSLAGILAAKQAVSCLLSDLSPGQCVPAESVVIGHDSAAAPVIASIPEGSAQGARLFVSISHTGSCAWALAVAEVQERS
jgi:phosphopantetheinyl transferase (holo-ACP synthase)